MQNNRYFAGILTGFLAVSILVSCGQDTLPQSTDSSDSTDAVTTEAEEGFPLPSGNYDNYTVTMLTMDAYNEHFKLNIVEEDGDTLNDAGYKRNLAVSELLNVKFSVEETANPAETLKQSVMAGDTDYDFVFPHATTGVPMLVTDHILYNWNELPGVDLSNPWWNQEMSNSIGIGDNLFYVSGDIVMTWQGMQGIVFNKEYLNQLNLKKSLYDIVFDGEWTLDYMTEIIKGMSEDVDGDSAWTAKDRYGLLTHKTTGYTYMYAADQRVTTPDSNGFPTLSLNTERMTNIVEKYYNLIYSGDTFVDVYYSTTYATSTYRSMLIEGRSFLTALDIGGLYQYLREIEFDFGILPMPKYDKNQENYRVFCGAGLIGIPTNAPYPERTGKIAEAMGYYSYQYIRPVFFNNVLENKALRDENSYKIIQLMYQNKVFDFGFNFDATGSAYGILDKVVISQKNTNIVSTYLSMESQIQAGFDKIVDEFRNQSR